MQNMFDLTPAVKVLLIANILIYILTSLTAGSSFDVQALFSLYDPHAEQFQVYQIISSIFLHADIMHIFFNMFALVMFGKFVERAIGSQRFMILFLVCGIGANLLNSAVSYYRTEPMVESANLFIEEPTSAHLLRFTNIMDIPHENASKLAKYLDEPTPTIVEALREQVTKTVIINLSIRSLGASGAVFGIMLAFALIFPNLELMLIFPPIPIKAKYMVLIYGAFELVRMFQNNPNDNIAHFVHLSGMLFAFVMVKLIWKVPKAY